MIAFGIAVKSTASSPSSDGVGTTAAPCRKYRSARLARRLQSSTLRRLQRRRRRRTLIINILLLHFYISFPSLLLQILGPFDLHELFRNQSVQRAKALPTKKKACRKNGCEHQKMSKKSIHYLVLPGGKKQKSQKAFITRWQKCKKAKSIHYLVFPDGPPPEY